MPREIRFPLPDLSSAKDFAATTKRKADDAQVAVGTFMLDCPNLTFWVLLLLALAGGKLLAQMGR